jgi:hypothetical protein
MGLDDRFKYIGHFRLLFLSGDSTPPNGSHRPWRFPFGGSIAPSVVRAGRTRILPVRSASGRSWPDSAPTWGWGTICGNAPTCARRGFPTSPTGPKTSPPTGTAPSRHKTTSAIWTRCAVAWILTTCRTDDRGFRRPAAALPAGRLRNVGGRRPYTCCSPRLRAFCRTVVA